MTETTYEILILGRAEKKASMIEQVLSGLSIIEGSILKKKGQDKASMERVFKTRLDFNSIEYTVLLDAYKVSSEEVVLYADLDTSYDLSLDTIRFTADNKAFIEAVKSLCIEVNNGDLPEPAVKEAIQEALFRVQEKIQVHFDDKLAIKMAG
ncbi:MULTISPECIES: hypothetical protein [unclassified Halomonas]|uniref:hypothetical protein n=1 Tax=unclassified Halomonas TaxID=2609666 RepID=UPI004033D2F1